MSCYLFSPRHYLIITLTLLLLTPTVTLAATWNVPGDAATIQAGINLAGTGDTVIVGPGTWSGGGNVNLSFGGTDLTLISSDGRDQTTINCGGSARAFLFNSGESPAAMVQGFTILSGNATTGGGILIDDASPIIKDCRFAFCYASSHGGAADLKDTSAPRFEDCLFESNSTSGDYHTGGAIRLEDDAEFIRCEFRGNAAGGIGGAIRMYEAGDVTFESCLFEDNTATDGGAVMIQTAITTDFESCLFIGNYVSSSGGAINITGGLNTFTNCLFDQNRCDNTSGAFYVLLGDAILNNCTVARTTSAPDWGALTVTNSGVDIDLNNTIIYGSLSGSGVQCRNYGDVTPVCSNLFGNADGDWDDWCGEGEDTQNGNYSLDPIFCDADNGDFQLSSASPCLETPGCGLVGAFGQGCEAPSAVDEPIEILHGFLDLEPAAPNPAGQSTHISYTIRSGSDERLVNLTIHDINGRLVRELINKNQTAGSYTVSWDGANQSGDQVEGGVYFYQLRQNGETVTRRLLLVR